MAFCSECGNDIGDNIVCPVCGAVNENICEDNNLLQTDIDKDDVVIIDSFGDQTVPVLFDDTQFRRKKFKRIISVCCLALILVFVMIYYMLSGNGAENITVTTLNAVKNADINALIQTVPYEYMYENNDYGSSLKAGCLRNYQMLYMQLKAFWGIDLSDISWEIKKTKDYDEDDFEELQDEWDDMYDIIISDAKTVKVKIIDGENDKNVNFDVVKINGKWYMKEDPLSFFVN